MLRKSGVFFMLMIFGNFFNSENVDAAPVQKTTYQFCSHQLSDALHLLCMGRGYNEPDFYHFYESSLSTDIDSAPNEKRGVVDECCHKSCTMEQLLSYCKPKENDDEKNGETLLPQIGARSNMELTIVTLPNLTVHEMRRHDKSLDAEKSAKSKLDHFRHRGFHSGVQFRNENSNNQSSRMTNRSKCLQRLKNNLKNGNLIGKSAFNNCRSRRPKSSRGKIEFEGLMDVRVFKIGTMAPEPSDSVLVFPSGSYLNFRRATQSFTSDEQQGHHHLQ